MDLSSCTSALCTKLDPHPNTICRIFFNDHLSNFVFSFPPESHVATVDKPCKFTIMGGAPVTPPTSSSTPPLYPPPQQIAPHLTLQAPLSRRGRGPGLVLVLDHYARVKKSEKHLDPPPLTKWAEEGFAVVQVSFVI